MKTKQTVKRQTKRPVAKTKPKAKSVAATKSKVAVKPRTKAGAKVKQVRRQIRERVFESDSTYFLKLIVVFILGTFWIKFSDPVLIGDFYLAAIPVGVFAGFVLVRKLEKHQSNRKIMYALLIVTGVISNFQAAGIVI